MAPPSVASIISDIVAAGKKYESNAPGAREQLVDLGQALSLALEIPSEFIQRSMWAEPAVSATNRMAVKLKLFQHLKDAGDKGLTIPELAELTGVDASLLGRLMRHLVAMKVLRFSPDGRLQGTRLTDGLAEDRFQSAIEFCYDFSRPSFNAWPAYFASVGYRDVVSPTQGPWQYTHRKETDPEHFFQWLEANPPNVGLFASFMRAYRAGHANWWDEEAFYPLRDRLVEGFDKDVSDVFLVDVGGGRGQDLDQLFAVHKKETLPGRIILQDQAPVVAGIEGKETKEFETMTHDFFTPEPVCGARAYHLHSILHDWDDKDCSRILENLKPALKSGYSRVLFYEIVMSEEKPSLASTCMDLQMLAHLGVQERTETQWRRLLGEAGYEITNIYFVPGSAESLIEAQLKDIPN